MMPSMEYAVIIEPADDGSISVWVPDLPGCVSTGDTREEALANIAEAIRGHVEALRAAGEPVPAARSSAGVARAA
jgi:predicted RNase H-like HicB family nuclease